MKYGDPLLTSVESGPCYNVRITGDSAFMSWSSWNPNLQAAQSEYQHWCKIWPEAKIELLRREDGKEEVIEARDNATA